MGHAKRIYYAADRTIDLTLHKLVNEARRIQRREFPKSQYPRLNFDAIRWDLNDSSTSSVTRGYFAHFHPAHSVKSGAPVVTGQVANSFFDVIKAWLVFSNTSEADTVSSAYAAEIFLRTWSTNHHCVFLWDMLSAFDFSAAAEFVENEYPKSAYTHESKWARLLRWLQINEVVNDSLEWTPSARRRGARHVPGQNEDVQRLPRRDVLEALGRIHQGLATDARDRLLICSIGLLFVGGFRKGELVTLPANCWVTETIGGRNRHGIRYWNEKTGDGHFKFATRWLSPLGAELAKQCLDEIIELTAEARKQAYRLEAAPDSVPVNLKKRLLNREEVAKLLNLKPRTVAYLVRDGKLTPKETVNRKWLYRREDVEREILNRRAPLNTLQISPTKYQKLSETLLIEFQRHSNAAETSSLLVRRVPETAIDNFLGAQEKIPSAFEKFGLNERFTARGEDPLRVRAHAIRHWLNTVAYNAGMTAFQITVWMQRTSIEMTMLYLHETNEIANYTKEMLRDSRLVGALATEYLQIGTEEARQQFLSTIKDAHVASTVLCSRLFRFQRCDRSKACESGCPHALSVIGDDGPLPALLEKRRTIINAIERIDAEQASGSLIVSRQREFYKELGENVDHMIAVAEGKSCQG